MQSAAHDGGGRLIDPGKGRGIAIIERTVSLLGFLLYQFDILMTMKPLYLSLTGLNRVMAPNPIIPGLILKCITKGIMTLWTEGMIRAKIIGGQPLPQVHTH
jgi:hypothetical protein